MFAVPPTCAAYEFVIDCAFTRFDRSFGQGVYQTSMQSFLSVLRSFPETSFLGGQERVLHQVSGGEAISRQPLHTASHEVFLLQLLSEASRLVRCMQLYGLIRSLRQPEHLLPLG